MPQKQIPNLNIPDDLETKYVNFVRISHNATEFILDFSLILPGMEQPHVDSRLVMSPIAMKLFLRAMADNINRYETQFGEINLPVKHSLADDLFRPDNKPEDNK